MKTCTLLFTIGFLVNVNGHLRPLRIRRDVEGSLDIISNNVQPIHADVKSDIKATEKERLNKFRTHMEFILRDNYSYNFSVNITVTPPLTFQQSLRKSLEPPSKLELARTVSRLVLLLTLTVSALIELYPALAHLVATFFSFLE